MNCTIKHNQIEYFIQYSVDSEGDYDRFEIWVGDYLMNNELKQEVIDKLEYKVWHEDFVPETEQHNTDNRIWQKETSMEY